MILYPDGSMGFRLEDFSLFGQACFCGNVPAILQALQSGTAPSLSTKESAYEQGYATLIVLGSQRLQSVDAPGSPKVEHLAVLELLIDRGLPLDLPDIGGFTALHHSVLGHSLKDKEGIIRKLLSSGADANHQNRWGSTPLHNAAMRGDGLGIELLMEYGARIDIPDGNGYTVKSFYLSAGPVVNAAMEKWLTKRMGKEEAPMTEKRCDKCGILQKGLKICSGCRTVQYCSKECQRDAWSTHKVKCKTFDSSTSVTLVAFYPDSRFSLPLAALQRGQFAGLPTEPVPLSQMRTNQAPSKIPAGGKRTVVKIQVPPVLRNEDGSYNNLMVYTQKRDFSCMVRRQDCPKEFDRVYEVIKNKTISGLKGYFSAEIQSRDEFAVKVSEVLASQPW